MTQRRAPSLADTLPNQVEVDRLVPDNQDTVILTRPFPDADEAAMEARRGRTESLPTIGQIARYALKYTLGEGGLGTVYAAHDPLLQLQERLAPRLEDAAQRLYQANERVKGFIRDNPGACLLGAAALGFLAGRLADRR